MARGRENIHVEALSPNGGTDPYSHVELTPDGVVIESTFLPSLGLTWESLHRLVSDPRVQDELERVELMNLAVGYEMV